MKVHHELQVGALYDPSRGRWPEGATLRGSADGYELVIRFSYPSPHEVGAVALGRGVFGFYEQDDVLLGLYRFWRADSESIDIDADDTWDSIPWSVAQVEPHGWSQPPRAVPCTLKVVLVNASTGIIRAIRSFPLPEPLSTALQTAALRVGTAVDAGAFEASVASAKRRYAPAQMGRLTPYIFVHPSRQPSEIQA